MKIVFAAGGTGGHINPALSAAGEVQRRYPDAEILFIGTADHMEARLVPAAGLRLKPSKSQAFNENPRRKISSKTSKPWGCCSNLRGKSKRF